MNIIVTGASRGIGFETVKSFVNQGNHKIIALSRNIEKLISLKKECEIINSSSDVIPVNYDLSVKTYNDLIKLIESYFSSVDILINNAGYLVSEKFENFKEEQTKQIFEINFFAPARLIKSLLPLLRKSKNAHIINISSMGGFQGSAKFEGLSYYSASKAAIASLTECLALEFINDNIAVNCFALGAVQTEMLAQAFPGYKAPIQADEMAKNITNFALNGHKYYNGKILPVSLSTP